MSEERFVVHLPIKWNGENWKHDFHSTPTTITVYVNVGLRCACRRFLGPIKPSFIERRQHIFPHKKGHGDLLTTLASCWHATIYWDSTCRRREALGITLKYNKGIAALSGRPFFHPLLILDFSLQDPHSISRLSVFVNGISISAIKLSSCARPGFLFHTDKYERRARGGYDAGLDSDCLLR